MLFHNPYIICRQWNNPLWCGFKLGEFSNVQGPRIFGTGSPLAPEILGTRAGSTLKVSWTTTLLLFQIKHICLNYLISSYKLQILHRSQSLRCTNQAQSHMLSLYSCEVLQSRPSICIKIKIWTLEIYKVVKFTTQYLKYSWVRVIQSNAIAQ